MLSHDFGRDFGYHELLAIKNLIEVSENLLDNAALFNHESDPIWVELKARAIKTINKAKGLI